MLNRRIWWRGPGLLRVELVFRLSRSRVERVPIGILLVRPLPWPGGLLPNGVRRLDYIVTGCRLTDGLRSFALSIITKKKIKIKIKREREKRKSKTGTASILHLSKLLDLLTHSFYFLRYFITLWLCPTGPFFFHYSFWKWTHLYSYSLTYLILDIILLLFSLLIRK